MDITHLSEHLQRYSRNLSPDLKYNLLTQKTAIHRNFLRHKKTQNHPKNTNADFDAVDISFVCLFSRVLQGRVTVYC
jgi:hypothetical protein